MPDETLAERIRAAAELLETIAQDRSLLAGIPEADRTRLLQSAGQVSRPDAIVRRQLVKETKRQKKDLVDFGLRGKPLIEQAGDEVQQRWLAMQMPDALEKA